MAFDFPASPTVDLIYISPDGIKFVWDGQAWMKGSGSGIPGGGTGPTIPPVGDDGEALVAQTGNAVWGAPINAGSF